MAGLLPLQVQGANRQGGRMGLQALQVRRGICQRLQCCGFCAAGLLHLGAGACRLRLRLLHGMQLGVARLHIDQPGTQLFGLRLQIAARGYIQQLHAIGLSLLFF